MSFERESPNDYAERLAEAEAVVEVMTDEDYDKLRESITQEEVSRNV